MTASVARISDVLGIGHRPAVALATLGMLGVAVASALAVRQGLLLYAVAGLILVLGLFAGFRRPLVLLLLFAALIPIEEVIVIEGFGTFSRVAGLLFVVTYGASRLGSLKPGVMPVAGWAYLAWAIASLSWSLRPDVASAQLPTLIQLFVIAVFIADYVVRSPEIVRPVMWAYSLSAAGTALIGVLAYLAEGLGTARSVAIQNQDPAQFAALLLPGVVFGLFEAINGQRRVLGGAIALLTTAGVIVSGTRGAWVACVVVVLFVLLPQLTPRRRIMAVVTIVAVLAVVYQLPGIAALIADRSGNALSSGGAGRTDIWAVGFTIFGSSPLTGVGYANFPVAFTSEVIRAAGVGWEWLARAGAGSHNVVVSTSVELGAVGLVLLGLFVGPLMLRRGWGPDAAMIQGALVALFTTALFLDILANRKQVWLVIALAAGLAYVARAERRKAAGGRAQAVPEVPAPALPPEPDAAPPPRPRTTRPARARRPRNA